MRPYKEEFIDFMVRSGVLTFGDFVTKSGRRTPYFINTGNYDTGEKMARLGYYFAAALRDVLGEDFDNLYGPAYKGIPLCVAAAVALARDFGQNVTFTFNRKEAKGHGEKGALIGHQYKGGERVAILDDVTTDGASKREAIETLRAACPQGIDLRAVVISVDRMERGSGEKSALAEIAGQFGVKTFAIVTIDEIVERLRGRKIDGRLVLDDALLARVSEYRAEYGAK
jgi:orotate phosphoribosyltransferase